MNAHTMRPTERDDATLVRALAQGDLEALGAMYDAYEPVVRRYIARLGVPAGDLDDLVQDVFLDAARAAARYSPELGSARSWLFGIATMMVRRHRRSFARTLARLVAWASLSREGPATPSEVLETNAAAARFEAAFHALSAKRREAFTLVVLEEVSGEEAAHILGIPINTLWTRLHHARRDLRRAVEEES